MYCNNCGTSGGPMHVHQGLNYCSDECIEAVDLGCGFDFEVINQEIEEGRYTNCVTKASFGSGINADILY